MRIIAGEFRGRRILPPAGSATRPITDRVKQSLFDIISGRLEGARVYDCFAGTGSMGLEALSRGAEHVTFFEIEPSAVVRLKRNLATLNVSQRAAIVDRDLFAWLDRHSPDRKADLIFFDPPYRFIHQRDKDLRRALSRLGSAHLSADGVIIFRHQIDETLDLATLAQVDRRDYGSMAIDFLSRK